MSRHSWENDKRRQLAADARRIDAERTQDDIAERRAMPAELLASWGGTCHLCGDAYAPGDEILWQGSRRQVTHLDCGFPVALGDRVERCWICLADLPGHAVLDPTTKAYRHPGCDLLGLAVGAVAREGCLPRELQTPRLEDAE